MRVAIVHDYLTQFGGAERVLLALMELFPHAPVFTLIYDEKRFRSLIPAHRVKTSFLQSVPGSKEHHRSLPLLMPLAVEQFDFSDYDIVLSSTHSFGKGIITGPSTFHISYCFTPTRYVWDDCHRYVREFSRSTLFQRFAPLGLSYIRMWDYYASQRVDAYLTLSDYVAKRIRKYYQREALVIPPPVDIERFKVSNEKGRYFLVVSRLVPYKRIDLAINACEEIGIPLVIVGSGPEYEALEARAGKMTKFLGFVPDEKLPEIYAGALALLFPQEEDFGITPLEAAACGKPTIAFDAGGARETIVNRVTGLFFDKQDSSSLVTAMLQGLSHTWDPQVIRAHAEKYQRENFLQTMREAVHTQWMSYQKTHKQRV